MEVRKDFSSTETVLSAFLGKKLPFHVEAFLVLVAASVVHLLSLSHILHGMQHSLPNEVQPVLRDQKSSHHQKDLARLLQSFSIV